jgi:hypothetical protein
MILSAHRMADHSTSLPPWRANAVKPAVAGLLIKTVEGADHSVPAY